MEIQNQILLNEKKKKNVDELKKFIEELELQLSLGLAETVDNLEEHKNNFKNFIEEAKDVLKSFDELSQEYAPALREKFDELLLQLSLGKAETKDILEDQKDKIINILNVIEKHLLNNDYDENIFSFLDSLGLKSDKLKSFLEIARLKYALGKADLKDEFEKNKIEIEKKVQKIKTQIENDIDKKTYTDIKKEISDLLNHIKRVADRIK